MKRLFKRRAKTLDEQKVRALRRRRWRPRLKIVTMGVALLVGWGAVAFGLANATGRPDIVYPVMGGLIVLLLLGVRFLGVIFWNGLYVLSSDVSGSPKK